MSKQAIEPHERGDHGHKDGRHAKAGANDWGRWATQANRAMFGWISEVATTISANRVGDVLGGAITSAARTKAQVDRNIASLLSMANLPSKRDYERLQTKIDSLQGTLINLSRKLDRLASELDRGNGAASGLNGRAPATAAARKSAASKPAAGKAAAHKRGAAKTGASKRTRARKPSA